MHALMILWRQLLPCGDLSWALWCGWSCTRRGTASSR